MGVLGSLLNGMAKSMAEQAWPMYQQACMKDESTICAYLDNETNYFKKTIWLLALSKKSTYKTQNYYKQNQNAYNNQLNNLSKYDRFQREIDVFMKKM